MRRFARTVVGVVVGVVVPVVLAVVVTVRGGPASAAFADVRIRPGAGLASAPARTSTLSIVPQPRRIRVGAGHYIWPSPVRIVAAGENERNVAQQLRAYLAANGVSASLTDPAGNSGTASRSAKTGVVLRAVPGSDPRLGDEGYALDVRTDGVTMRANTARGLFYALQTLEQVTARSGARLESRIAAIEDWPAYRWRGIHLDVARHFFSVPVLERYIDLAARYKLNVFHWHLTDDQAWRLHSDRYPALGAAGAQYSRADVRRVVAYAAQRSVTVVPEIDLPSHAGAALRTFPQLSCGRGTLCPSGAALVFARNVLADAAQDFPSPYIHAGGDEVPPPFAGAQPRFTRTIERSIEARGRRLVGWDEIFTPGLSKRAVIMVWTSRARAAQAARNGNDVVVASAPLYLDAAQGDPAQEPRAGRHMSTLERVYDDPVIPAGLAPKDAAHILGGQGEIWTEHITTERQLFYTALPRELALAEILWTPRDRKSWSSFLARLPAQLTRLDAGGYTFRIPNATFTVTGGRTVFEALAGRVQSVAAWTTASTVTVALGVPLTGAVIRYTTDGTAPSPSSPRYDTPFIVRTTQSPIRLRAAAFFHARQGAVTECIVARVSPAAIATRTHTSKSWASLVSP